ncbi:MAG: hypothetical protein IIZ19_03180 [Clostridia bacterium]|nr:hypothetical protein [Clostridia bacterium]
MFLAVLMVLTLAAIPAGAAGEQSDPQVISYELTSTNGRSTVSIGSGSKVDLKVKLVNTAIKTSDIASASDLDINKLLDSFTQNGTTQVHIDSSGDEPLALTINFQDLTYTGSGQSCRFMIGYKSLSIPYDEVFFTVKECVEYREPIVDEYTQIIERQAPVVEITRDRLNTVIEPGQQFIVNVNIKNCGSTDMMEPVAKFTVSDDIVLLEGSSSRVLPRIRPDKTESFSLSLMALDEIENPSQSLTVEVSFAYNNGSSTVRTTATEKLNIQAKTFTKNGDDDKDADAPQARISRQALGKISAGDTFTVGLTVENTGERAMISPRLKLTPSDSLMILEDSSSKLLSDIAPGEKRTVNIKMKALDEIKAASQAIDCALDYKYMAGNNKKQATLEEHIVIPCAVSESGSGAEKGKPNVIVSSYSYGGEQVAAGQSFALSVSFYNTSDEINIENLILTVEPAEGVTIISDSNTSFYKFLPKNDSRSRVIRMKAMPTAAGPVKLSLKFTYEYVTGGKRYEASSEENITVPVYQPDRFEITKKEGELVGTQFEEMYITLDYVNKGKGTVSNVSAEIEGDVEAVSSFVNLGNIESGKSGTIDFIVTPQEIGVQELTVKVTYEDADENEVVREYPVTLNVEEYVDYSDMYDEEYDDAEEGGSGGVPFYVWIIIAAAAAVAVIVIVKRRKKKKKSLEKVNDFKWEDDDEEPQDENTAPESGEEESK